MNIYIALSIIIILSYLVGSIPTAVIISKLVFGFDIRDKGSGNMGSTNAFRVLGAKWGVTVQILDVLKGVIPVVFIASLFNIQFSSTANLNSKLILQLIAGVSAVLGHIWTVFAGFRGGKGINTMAGMMIAMAPIDFGIGLLIFFIVVFFSGYISLGSMIGSMCIPLAMLIRHSVFHVDVHGFNVMIYCLFAVASLVIYTHRKNIKRLKEGNENKFEKLQLFKLKK